METTSIFDVQTEVSEGGLKELVLRWFNETQAQFLLDNGIFPSWFQGFATRKDVEDLLRNEALGSFLVRLSEKAVGYILSYKSSDRCRHFVITQNRAGLFSLSGDSQTYSSLTQLIEHYKVRPILPFGEYLTSSCHQENAGDFYDAVNFEAEGKSGVSVKALQALWDQRSKNPHLPGNSPRMQQQSDNPTASSPALPTKSKTWRLTGTLSADAVTYSQAAAPKGEDPLGLSLSQPLSERQTLTDSNRVVRLRGSTNPEPARAEGSVSFNCPKTSRPGDNWTTDMTLKQLQIRSQSLPKLDNTMEEDNHSNGTSFTMSTSNSPTSLKKVTSYTQETRSPRSLHNPRLSNTTQEQDEVHETSRSNLQYQTCSSQQKVNMYAEVSQETRSPRSLHNPRLSNTNQEQNEAHETWRSNPLYQTSSSQQKVHMYAEVSQETRSQRCALHDDTYEQIPGEDAMYETLEDIKITKSKSSCEKKCYSDVIGQFVTLRNMF
ncbi:uncharacterized protein LOC117501506 [Thalassophryne amazonica]|uniref:uncharacterized protein LOC117501506 n=1 Tax=Thalassophryne amazonica TaxID=390379 RepID=UPI0014709718|nr:uncharacterized protein LOC117501506 [Thalassophryne amazonica]